MVRPGGWKGTVMRADVTGDSGLRSLPMAAWNRAGRGLMGVGVLALGVALVLLGGCTVHPQGPHGPVCPLIEDAAQIIEYPSQRHRILKRVADMPELSTHEQIYLVNATFATGYSSDKAETLVRLIKNPCCTEETRQHIRKMLKLSRMKGRDQRRVVETLDNFPEPGESKRAKPERAP